MKCSPRVIPILLFLFFTSCIILSVADIAWARLGGGEFYGGGGDWGGGGGGNGDGYGVIIYLLIRLCIAYPQIGIPVTIIIIIIVLSRKADEQKTSYASRISRSQLMATDPQRRILTTIEALKQDDPNFSRPLFLDFACLLYSRFHESRGVGDFSPLAPYLSPKLLEQESLKRRQADLNLLRVSGVIVGSMLMENVITTSSGFTNINMIFDANYEEHFRQRKKEIYTKERWTFRRRRGVLSKAPEEISSLNCPSCGAPVELKPDGSCTYCGRIVTNASFHWQVSNIVVIEKCPRVAPRISWRGIEEGTELPTLYHPNFAAEKRAFSIRYPDFSWERFLARVRFIFTELQKAWTTKSWELARPYESDHLFTTHRYWIENYKAYGLTNYVEQVEIEKIIPVKIERDAFFDSITVRIWANCLDYTVDSDGKLVGGSKKQKRRFSEYWTFIRRAGFKGKGEAGAHNCPNCGAPLDKISMTGICEYCGSKLTSGEFDWVLSTIEQDEAYKG